VFYSVLCFIIPYILRVWFGSDIYVMPVMYLEREFSSDELARFIEIMHDRRDNFIGDLPPRFTIMPENGIIKIKPLNDSTNWIFNELKSLNDLGRLLVTTEKRVPTCIYSTTINVPNITNESFLIKFGPIAERWRVLNINQIMPHQFIVTFQVDIRAHRFIIMNQNRIRFGRTMIEVNLQRIEAPMMI